MIKNEKQYNVTKKKLSGIGETMDKIRASRNPLPSKEELILVSLTVMKEQMEDEIRAFDQLRTSDLPALNERSIDNLPELLIEYKIHSRMTQKEFSKKVGMKEQQLQRYEAEDFRSISFRNLLKILHAIGLEITVKGSIRQNPDRGQTLVPY